MLDEAQCSLRPDVADDQLPAQVKLDLLALTLRVEVRGLMVLVEHADHDTKKRRDDRHASIYIGVPPRSVQHRAKPRRSILPCRQLQRFVRRQLRAVHLLPNHGRQLVCSL